MGKDEDSAGIEVVFSTDSPYVVYARSSSVPICSDSPEDIASALSRKEAVISRVSVRVSFLGLDNDAVSSALQGADLSACSAKKLVIVGTIRLV